MIRTKNSKPEAIGPALLETPKGPLGKVHWEFTVTKWSRETDQGAEQFERYSGKLEGCREHLEAALHAGSATLLLKSGERLDIQVIKILDDGTAKFIADEFFKGPVPGL